MRPKSPEPIERITIKLPKSLAVYFRKTFRHGQRSKFVMQCILDYKHKNEIDTMESQLRKAGKARQGQQVINPNKSS